MYILQNLTHFDNGGIHIVTVQGHPAPCGKKKEMEQKANSVT